MRSALPFLLFPLVIVSGSACTKRSFSAANLSVPETAPAPREVRISCPEGTRATEFKLRAVAANLSSGNRQNYDGGEGKRILAALKPDLVLIQEFNYKGNNAQAYQEFAGEVLGMDLSGTDADAHYWVEKERADKIPNGVISRFPFKAKATGDGSANALDAGEWTDASMPDRDFAWGKIDLPGNRDLLAVSVHLKASADGRNKRVAQAKNLVELVSQNAGPADFALIGGDFNTQRRNEPCVDVFTQRIEVPNAKIDLPNRRVFAGKMDVAPQGFSLSDPAAAENVTREGLRALPKVANINTNANRNSPYDWVLADLELDKFEVPVELGNAAEKIDGVDRFPQGLVFDSRSFIDLSLAPGVHRADSAAPGMQHMAVVRDFSVPYCAPTQ